MIYYIYANRSDIGDWLSAKGIQNLLSPLEITHCLCDVPFIEETMNRLSAATEKDLIIIGGGGLIMDYFAPFWEAFRSVAERVPFCLWGIGCCDLKNEFSLPPKSLIEDIVNKSKLCIVRDNLTRTFLEDCEIPPPVLCPSVNAVDTLLEKGKDLLHVVNYTTAGAETYEAMCSAAEMFVKKTGRVYRETNNLVSRDSQNEMAQILSRYQKSDIVLSSALHGCIIGVAMGLKVLAVSGDRKIDAFMEAVNLKEWVLDTDEINLVPKHLQEMESQINPISILEDARRDSYSVAQKILDIIGNSNQR